MLRQKIGQNPLFQIQILADSLSYQSALNIGSDIASFFHPLRWPGMFNSFVQIDHCFRLLISINFSSLFVQQTLNLETTPSNIFGSFGFFFVNLVGTSFLVVCFSLLPYQRHQFANNLFLTLLEPYVITLHFVVSSFFILRSLHHL